MIAEDGIDWNGQIQDDVCRGSVPNPTGVAVTVSTYGQVQNVTQSFPIDAGWVPANLHILAVAGLNDGRGVVGAGLVGQGAVTRAHLRRTGDVVVTVLARISL